MARSRGATRAEQAAFVERFSDIALEISKATGVAPEVVLGQTALETGWGKSVAGGNMFGIKGQGQMVTTKEHIPGRGMVTVRDSFRAYDDPVESFKDYADITIRGKSLSDIVTPDMTVEEQARAIKASGYATDPNYARSLASTARTVRGMPGFQNAVVSAATASIPVAGLNFDDVIHPDVPVSPVPSGWVETSSIPDITPASAGFSLEDFSPVDAAMPDFSGVHQGMTERQAVEAITARSGQQPRFSENVEIRTTPDIPVTGRRTDKDYDIHAATLASKLADMGVVLNDEEISQDFYGWDPAAEAFTQSQQGVSFPEITEGLFPDAPQSMSQNTFDDVFNAGFPMESFTPVDAAPVNLSDVPTGPQPSGFSAGVGNGPWSSTPDFSAPSLEQRNAEAFNQSAISTLGSQIGSLEQSLAANELAQGAWNDKVLSSPTLGSFDTTRAGIRDQEAEYGIVPDVNPFDVAFSATPDLGTYGGLPSMASLPGPALAPAPIETVTARAPTSTGTIPQGDFDEFGASFPQASTAPRASAPVQSRAPSQAPASLPSALPETAPLPPSRQQMEISKQFDLPSFSMPGLPDLGLPDLPSMPTARDVGGFFGMSPETMDTIGNFMDSRTGKALTGAGVGFLTGGPIGAVTNGLWGGLGIGDRLSQEFDRYANAYANLSPLDFAAFGLDGNWTDREPTRNTGYEGGSRVGDGSYSDFSGYNDNNPQGIL